MNEIVLQTKGLTKRYGNQNAADDISLTVRKGDILGLVGQNGAGKTTLIRMITSLAYPDQGEMELLGAKGEADLEEARKRMGCIIESPAFYKKLTAKQNLEYFRIQRGIKDKTVVDRCLKLVNLDNTGNKKFMNFSLGMKQRLGLALAIMNNPDFVILDEPVNGLDPTGIVEIRQTIKKLSEEGITIMLSSHILSELSMIATRYAFIHKGKLIKEIDDQQLKDECRKYIKMIINDAHQAKAVLKKKFANMTCEVVSSNEIHVISESAQSAELIKCLSTNDIVVSSISEIEGSLEDYYVNLLKEVERIA